MIDYYLFILCRWIQTQSFQQQFRSGSDVLKLCLIGSYKIGLEACSLIISFLINTLCNFLLSATALNKNLLWVNPWPNIPGRIEKINPLEVGCTSVFPRKAQPSSTIQWLSPFFCGRNMKKILCEALCSSARSSSFFSVPNVWCVRLAEHGGPRRGGRGPWGGDQGGVREIRQSGQVCHFWGEEAERVDGKRPRFPEALTGLRSPQIAEVSDDEAVRIFLEFERVESAIKGQWRSLTIRSCHRHAQPIFCSEVDETLKASRQLLCNRSNNLNGVGPERKPGETRLPAALHHTQPPQPRHLPGGTGGPPYITDSPKKQDRHIERRHFQRWRQHANMSRRLADTVTVNEKFDIPSPIWQKGIFLLLKKNQVLFLKTFNTLRKTAACMRGAKRKKKSRSVSFNI